MQDVFFAGGNIFFRPPDCFDKQRFYGGRWVAPVKEVAIKILEPSFDVAVKGAQTVDSSNHPCDQAAEAAWRVARVWEYVSYKFVRKAPSLSVIVRSINSTSLLRVVKVHLSPLLLMATLKAWRSSLSKDGML